MLSLLISDTGPLIALGLVDKLGLLRHLTTRLVVPAAVRDEVEAGGQSWAGVAAFRAASWIEVGEVEPGPDPILTQLVGPGEAEVIQLARSLSADAVLVDDAKARRVAREAYGLNVIGTVRVLLESRRAGLIGTRYPIPLIVIGAKTVESCSGATSATPDKTREEARRVMSDGTCSFWRPLLCLHLHAASTPGS